MDQVGIETLRETIKAVHGCDSHWIETASVEEPYWTGDVQIFRLIGHASADRCYAWSQPAGRERRVHAVLHGATVDSAAQAVRATIVARERTRVF